MKIILLALLLLSTASYGAGKTILPASDGTYIDRATELALHCVHTEFPNTLPKRIFGKSPKEFHPAFYGCYDWHSSVHSHWVLVRLLRLDMNPAKSAEIRKKLNISLTRENILTEVKAFQEPGLRRSYELPYGFAWFLQLTAELHEWDNPDAKRWLANLKPLESLIVERLRVWAASMNSTLKIGTHNNSAFALGLILDWAKSVGNEQLAREFFYVGRFAYNRDRDCDLASEPERSDFLSPCLTGADLMRRLMPRDQYSKWLSGYLPNLPEDGKSGWLEVQRSAPSDTHLFGLNLSRAWMLEGIASALPDNDKRRAALLAEAKSHKDGGVAIVMSELDYMGSHWLGTFTLYLMTKRGISTGN